MQARVAMALMWCGVALVRCDGGSDSNPARPVGGGFLGSWKADDPAPVGEPSSPGDPEGSGTTEDPGSTEEPTVASNWPSLFVRGTFNDWGLTPMALEGDHQWVVEVASGEGDPRFLFDVFGDWRVRFGDDDGDLVADRDGREIPLEPAERLRIHFDDREHVYWVEVRTFEADVTVCPPRGIDPSVLSGRQVRLSSAGEDLGPFLVYHDAEQGRAFAPVSGLRAGRAYTLTFDAMVGKVRLRGEVSFTVDPAGEDPAPLTLELSEASLDDRGAVEVLTLADRWEDGALASSPFADVTVFLGDWHAGRQLGVTGPDGRVTVMVPEGRQVLGVMKMTSSHSLVSGAVEVDVTAGAVVSVDIHLAPTTVLVRAHCDAGFGNALYLTGASDHLGRWRTAVKMQWDPGAGTWTFLRNLPLGLPFKVVLAPWVDQDTIPTEGVRWEQGPDRVVTPPSGYVISEIDIWPTF
ncbi:MAG TPA: carbohydrate-binding module family 20 domain-containing protein [Myxococcota bacterium]|nr:carbohydrate-binding module family 20 domain-containing protein [Myxococcota bacterium]HQK51452.1 carbohydrate-binding module family 20 domain-containing protein [Myxococcota bacterium]